MTKLRPVASSISLYSSNSDNWSDGAGVTTYYSLQRTKSEARMRTTTHASKMEKMAQKKGDLSWGIHQLTRTGMSKITVALTTPRLMTGREEKGVQMALNPVRIPCGATRRRSRIVNVLHRRPPNHQSRRSASLDHLLIFSPRQRTAISNRLDPMTIRHICLQYSQTPM